MKFSGYTVLLCFCFFLFSQCKEKLTSKRIVSDEQVELKTLEDSANYFIGMNLAKNFSFFNGADFRPEMVEKAVNDKLEKDLFRLTNDQKKVVMTDYFMWAKKYHEDSVLAISRGFLAKNGERNTVTETSRGLQYEIISEGTSNESPDGNDVVKAIYKQGTAMKGILWDLKAQGVSNDTTLIALNSMCSGVSEAFQMMNPGDVFKIWVHPFIGSKEADDQLKVVQPSEVLYAEIEFIDFVERNHADITAEIDVNPGFFLDETKRYK